MNLPARILILSAVLVLGASRFVAAAPIRYATEFPVETPETIIADWPLRSRLLARTMMDRYGEPGIFGRNALAWFDAGDWKKITVYRSIWPNVLGMVDKDNLKQTIAFHVPDAMIEPLSRFDRRIEVDPASGNLSARTESEAFNYLAINIAAQIISGQTTVDDARRFYHRQRELSAAGKTSPYLLGFVFTVENERPTESGRRGPPIDAAATRHKNAP